MNKHIRGMIIILAAAAVTIAGCNRNGGQAQPPEAETGQEPTVSSANLTVSGNAGDGRVINFVHTGYEDPSAAQPAAQDPSDPAYVAPTPTPAPDGEGAPQFFDVEDPIEPVMGYCDNDMCDRMIEQLNMQRTKFGVSTLTKNSSLCVAADVRAREYSIYPVYKERPDGRPFASVSPQGYVKNEYFCIPARNSIRPVWDPQAGMWTDNNPPYDDGTYTPATVMEGLMEIREARNILLNSDYKQVGATWFVTGHYFITGFTLSY
ncbi:MAG: hypothetical protein K6F34_03275 [Lachnospiraceae bacterium]|nr:hypothetical protein [Lachnospiraceae bacterium]